MSSKCDICSKESVETNPDGWAVIDVKRGGSIIGTFELCKLCFISETGMIWMLIEPSKPRKAG